MVLTNPPSCASRSWVNSRPAIILANRSATSPEHGVEMISSMGSAMHCSTLTRRHCRCLGLGGTFQPSRSPSIPHGSFDSDRRQLKSRRVLSFCALARHFFSWHIRELGISTCSPSWTDRWPRISMTWASTMSSDSVDASRHSCKRADLRAWSSIACLQTRRGLSPLWPQRELRVSLQRHQLRPHRLCIVIPEGITAGP